MELGTAVEDGEADEEGEAVDDAAPVDEKGTGAHTADVMTVAL